MSSSKDEVLKKCNLENLVSYLALLKFFQKPVYPYVIWVVTNVATGRTVANLLDTSSGSKLSNSSILPPNSRPYVKSGKTTPSRSDRKQAVSTQGFISLHIYGRPTCTRMAWYCREPCRGPVIRGVIHWSMYLWPLTSRAKSRPNAPAPLTGGNTQISTVGHIAPQGVSEMRRLHVVRESWGRFPVM